MTVLSNGQVQITNSQTGETRVVDPTQLGSISPFLANQYFAYMTQQKALDKASGAGTGTTDTLTPPDNSVITGGDGKQNAPDLSGLSKYATPVKQQPQVKLGSAVGLSQGNQLAQQGQNNTPWIGSQIASAVSNYFKAPNLQAAPKPPGY